MIYSHNSQYMYAVGRIRALEARLLTPMKLNRLLEAKSVLEVAKVLSEYAFSSKAALLQDDNYRFEEVFEEEIKELYRELISLARNPVLIHVFQLRYDVLNCKLILKLIAAGEVAPSDVSEINGLSACGTTPPSQLFAAFKEKNIQKLPDNIKNIVTPYFSKKETELTGKIIDLILDKSYLSVLLELAQKEQSPFLEGIVRMFIDKYNLTVLFRGIFREETQELIFDAMQAGGHLDSAVLQKMAGWSFSDIVAYLEKTRYTKVAKQMIQRGHEHFIDSLEDSMMQCVLCFVNSTNYLIDGYEPVLSYLFKKETEIHNVRLIFAGKMHGLSQSILEEEVIQAL